MPDVYGRWYLDGPYHQRLLSNRGAVLCAIFRNGRLVVALLLLEESIRQQKVKRGITSRCESVENPLLYHEWQH